MQFKSLILIILIISGCASAPHRPTTIARDDYASTEEYIKKLIQYEMKKKSVAGLSIALVDDQHIIWSDGFGYADQELKTPATAKTIYRVGSISKLFTDTAAMQLVEQGRLDIDKPIKNYLPGFSIKSHQTNPAEITARQLMTHHSGLPHDRMKGFMNPHPASFAGLSDDIHNDYTNYPPNLLFSYSNLGVTLLGNIIQNQVGMPFADYMQQSVLVPLNMTNSTFETGLSSSRLMAKGYRDGKPENEFPLRDIPAGGLNSNVIDMSHFISMIFAGGTSGDHRILKAETINEMLRTQNADVPLDFNFHVGLGWMLSTLGGSTIENGGKVAHHGGDTFLYHSQMYLLPEHKLGVVVLSNSSTARQTVDHIATETLKLALEAKSGIHQPEHTKVKVDDKPLNAETVQTYVGDYTTLAGFARIKACGNGLCANVANHSFDFVHGSDGLFRLDYSLLGIFHINLGTLGDIGLSRRTLNGRDLLVARVGSQELLVGQRIVPTSNEGAWKQFLGDYEITNLDNDFKSIDHISLIEDQDFLLVEITPVKNPSEKVRIPLMPISTNEALILGMLNDGGDTVRIVKVDGEERLLYSGYLLKKLLR